MSDLCSDCPPRGYPTDRTRCSACPRLSIGDRVLPAPKPKLDVRPKSWSDSKAKGPRGVFQNGGNSR